MNSKQSWNNESGASLVAILVTVALFGVVAVMAAQSFRNIGTSGRRVEAAMSAREVESVMMQALVSKFKEYVTAGCSAQPTDYFEETDLGIAVAEYKKMKFYDAKGHQTTTQPAMAVEDLKRCNGTPFSNFTTPNSDTFYGCFNLMTNQSAKDKAAKGAFAGNRGAFVEMHVKLRNFKTDAVTSCATMVSGRGFGLEVYYALHWTTSAGADVMYDTKLGSLNVAY